MQIDNTYRINSEIREMVLFAEQNVIKDPPFTKLDLLSCRNMLIYMDSNLQEKLLSLFHYSLNQMGILILGSAETKNDDIDFSTIGDPRLRVYQRTGLNRSEELFNFPSAFSKTKKVILEDKTLRKTPENLKILTENLLLQQFAPASALVNDQGDIVYMTGNIGKYLTPVAGKANMNIFTMARDGLLNELPAAFRKARQNYKQVILQNVKVGTNGRSLLVDVNIQKIETTTALKDKIIVLFTDVPLKKQKAVKNKIEKTANLARQSEYEQEIQQLQEDLQITREEMQTSQEELKSTNEELQSSNEELQSTNEELTTSKEEMQSLNEELHTVNAELQSKVDASVRADNDMNNLLNSSEIATLFLDRELNIRQFTFHATKIFKLIRSDIGRPFTDLANNLIYPEMYNDAKEVLRTLAFVEKSIFSNEGLYYNIRIMPYRTLDDKIEGLVITFIDCTTSKQLEIALRENQDMLRLFIHTANFVIIALSENGSIIEFNPEAENLFGYSRHDVLNRSYFDLFIPEPLREKVKTDLKQLLLTPTPCKFENLVKSATNEQLKIEWTVHKQFDGAGRLTGLITIGENITPL